MRVLLCSHVAPPHIGGVENLVLSEAEALRAAGHDVVWVTSDADGDGRQLASGEHLEIVRIRAWHGIERRAGIAYPLFSPRLVTRLLREVARADLVHVHGLVFPASPVAAVLARLCGVPVLCTDHGGLLHYASRLKTLALRMLFATLGRLTARCAHRLIAYNEDLERLLTRLGGDREKVVFLPNPVDEALFRPPTAAERAAARTRLCWDARPRVLCVCRLLPHKGLDVLLAAADPAYALVFCGPGDDAVRERLRAGGAECLLPRPHHELRDLYHAADAFALPSYNEGFPVAIQEALACGLPVVTSDLPAYAPYRDTPGLHLCPPAPEPLRQRLGAVLAGGRPAPRPGAPTTNASARWVQRLCDGLPTARRRGALWLVAVAMLALHFVFTAVRWPVGAVGKRAGSIAEFTAFGEVGWHHRQSDDETRRIAAWIVATVPDGEVVLFRGNRQGALQLLAPALFPRLLVAAPPRIGERDEAGRPVFRGIPPWAPAGTHGTPVLVGAPNQLRLEFR